MKLKKILAAPFVVLLVAIAVVYALGESRHAGRPVGAVSVVAVTRGDIEETITAQGKLEPKNYVDVGAQVSGQLTSVRDIGAVVKKGDLLAEIDPEIYTAKVRADQAHLKTLQAQLTQQQAQSEIAKKQAGRNQQLLASKAISEETADQTDTAVKVAAAQVVSLEAQIEEQQSTLGGDQASLGYTRIYAPMDGTVVDQAVKQGQTVNSSQQAPTIVRIADLDVISVRAQVPEADISDLKEGMPVYFFTLGRQQKKWTAQVRQILPTPETINDVVFYDVLADVDNSDHRLRTGMTTEMFFVTGTAKDALLLPVAALGARVGNAGGGNGEAYSVSVQKGGGTTEAVVHVGLMDRNNAQILDGLAEGDKVLMPGAGGAP